MFALSLFPPLLLFFFLLVSQLFDIPFIRKEHEIPKLGRNFTIIPHCTPFSWISTNLYKPIKKEKKIFFLEIVFHDIYIKFAGNDRWKENFRTPGRPISVGMERALNKERSETSPRLPRSRGTKLSHCVLIRFTAACVAARRLDFCGVQKYASRCCNAAESRNTALYHPLDHFNL